MGTDIELHVEVKIKGKWEHYSHPKIERWYSLFTRLCGRRQVEGVTPISECRGLPLDLTKLTMHHYETDDGVTPSWINLNEIIEVAKDYGGTDDCQTFGHFFGSYYEELTPWKLKSEEIEDVRFVFWFDC